MRFDVAEAIALAVDLEGAAGKTYELGGPRAYTLLRSTIFHLQQVDRRRSDFASLLPRAYRLANIGRAVWRYVPRSRGVCWGRDAESRATGLDAEVR